jgi:hypothetical protein
MRDKAFILSLSACLFAENKVNIPERRRARRPDGTQEYRFGLPAAFVERLMTPSSFLHFKDVLLELTSYASDAASSTYWRVALGVFTGPLFR